MVVVSFEHNFIFIKTKKTAGTSMEIALSPYAGKDGVITPLARADEETRLGLFPDALPRNYSDAPDEEQEYRDAIGDPDADTRLARRAVKPHYKFYNHIPARLLRERLPEDFWQRAFKFTIERHPYEKVVSQAYFKLGKKGRRNFDRVLDDVVEEGAYSNYRLYTIGGAVVTDFIVRYEDMDADIRRVEEHCGIAIAVHMPSAKGSFRTDRRPAREILNDRQKGIVREACAEEFELFGYEP